MNSSRSAFLIGSASTLALAGCGGAASSLRPSVLSRQDGIVSPDSVGVRFVRDSPLRPVARFSRKLRAAYPTDSSVYYYGAFLVQDGGTYAAFPQSSTLYNDATGFHVYNDVARTTTAFSKSARVELIADAGETIVAPNQPLSPYLQSLVNAGQAHLVSGKGAVQSASRHSSDFEDDIGDDGGGYASGYGSSGNQITSAHSQCTAGGENIGITYTVPNDYTENVTVTQCVDNGTTNECFTFTDQVPGSTHTVSVWIAGHGAPNISMGIVSHSSTQEGVGWAFLGAC